MAVPSVTDDAPPDADADAAFARDAYLAYIVPQATDSRLEQALAACAGNGQSPQALIEETEEREVLFFDETVDVYLILRTPYQPEARVRGYLGRLGISLDAQVLNNHAIGRDAVPTTTVVETIFSGSVEHTDTPLAVVSDPDGNSAADPDDSEGDSSDSEGSAREAEPQPPQHASGGRQTYIVWKLPVFLSRPRARLQGPSVSFAAVASLRPPPPPPAHGTERLALPQDGGAASAGRVAGYLRSREPSGLNLLESFGGDPALAGVLPRLSAQRVARVAPAAAAAALHARRQPRPLRGLKALALRVVPAMHTRVRFARPSAAPTDPAVVAMLEVDCTPFFDCEAVLTRIDLSLPAGVVTDLNTADGLALPLYCVAHDHFTFLYRLAPLEYGQPLLPLLQQQQQQQQQIGRRPSMGPLTAAAGASTRELAVAIEAKVLVKPGVCTPALRMAWTTTLDFTLPVNPGFGTALLPPSSLQRAHRPSQLSIDGMSSFTAPSVSRPDALPTLEAAAARSTETSIPDFGITMTLTAPTHTVYAGEEFRWTVFVVNRASARPQTPPTPGLPPGGASGSGGVGTGAGAAGAAGAASAASTAAGAAAAAALQPARKLALIALPKRRRNDVRVLRPPSTAGARHQRYNTNGGGGGGSNANRLGGAARDARDEAGTVVVDSVDAVADAVLDENIVHAMQRSSLVDSTDVVCLSSADTRVGPLAPNACHVVELRFVALRAGVVAIEAIRVVDLGSQEHVDVRELPAMVIAEGRRAPESAPV